MSIVYLLTFVSCVGLSSVQNAREASVTCIVSAALMLWMLMDG